MRTFYYLEASLLFDLASYIDRHRKSCSSTDLRFLKSLLLSSKFTMPCYSPPPVLEMPATFNLELIPGQFVALDTTVSSDELDMARMEDGTTVDGQFWGKLSIVHSGDTHTMDFSGTRIINEDEVSPELLVDSKVITKLAAAAKPATAKCHLSILAPSAQYCDVTLSCSSLWKLGMTWPTAETVAENKVKYFLRVHPGGAAEHFETQMTTTSLYYEAMYVRVFSRRRRVC